MQNAGDIDKGHQTNSGSSTQRTTRRFVRNALRLKLHDAPAVVENRSGCYYITLPPIVCEDAIMANTHQTRR
jgi:hypothetical protein